MADFVDPLGAVSSLGGGAPASTSSYGSSPSDPSTITPTHTHSLSHTHPLAPAGAASASAVATPAAVSISLSAAPLKPDASSSSAGSAGRSPYLEWQARKAAVLKEFTVTGNIAVSANFMSDAVDEAGGEEMSVPLAKARQRLQQLEAAAKGLATVEMSQADYVRRIERLHKGLQSAWDNNQRVTALKICIQCAKLLGEPRVPQFYPSMFVMVTEILDTFGRLVFERLKSLADEEHKKLGGKTILPEDFISTDVGGEARETCRNWMYKTACIRELLPRLYVEMALLECYRFIFDADFAAIMLRLAHAIRGIGNPLVAIYARWYLVRMAARLVRNDNKQRESVLACVADYLFTFNEISTGVRQTQLEAMGVTTSVYLNLHSPAIGWQMHQLGWGASQDIFQGVMQQYKDHCQNSMVLKHIIDAFDPRYWVSFLPTMIALVKEAKPSLVTPADLYRSLALQLAKVPPAPEHRIPFLNEAWTAIRKVGDPVAYAKNAAALVELLLAAYTEREVLILLNDLVKRLHNSAIASGQTSSDLSGVAARAAARGGTTYVAPAAALPHLERILTSLVEAEVSRANAAKAASLAAPKFSGVMTSEAFTQLLDMFASEHKPALCKSLLTALTSVPGNISDPIVVNTMLEVARTCHDALDVLSSEDELRHITSLISAFVEKIDFGRDLERTLEVYVDCRQSFPNLDGVKTRLVRSAIELGWKALKFVKGKHSSKTATFVKSVFAYITITVPAIDDPFTRMECYERAGTCALHNLCAAQGDALLRNVIQEIPELPQSLAVSQALSGASTGATSTATDLRLYELLQSFTAAAVPAPGHPEHGPFYLARGLLAAVQRYPWQTPTQSSLRTRAITLVIPLLVAYSNDPLPVRIPGLDSNDVLYAGDDTYMDELRTLLRSVLEILYAQLVELKEAADSDPRSKTALVEAAADLLSHTEAIVGIDAGAAPALEQICALLRSHGPDHASVKNAVAILKARANRP